MKKIKHFPSVFLLFILFSIIMFIASCEKDYTTTKKVDLNTPVSFSSDVLPILTLECAKSGCHVSGGQSPQLTQSLAYDQLLGLGYVDTTNAEASILYVRMIASSNPMPPSGKLSADKTNYILAWIKQGAQNN